MLSSAVKLETLESVSKILAALLIPIALAYMGNEFTAANKQRETQARLVELALNILSKDGAPVTTEQRELRRWAVTVINSYSGVTMDASTQTALVNNTITLPKNLSGTDDGHATWAVVFGADTSAESAQHEITQVRRRYQITGQIYLRSGSYRSVVIADTRASAEDILARLKGYRSTSYLVDMSRWCPNTQQQSGYFDCRI